MRMRKGPEGKSDRIALLLRAIDREAERLGIPDEPEPLPKPRPKVVNGGQSIALGSSAIANAIPIGAHVRATPFVCGCRTCQPERHGGLYDPLARMIRADVMGPGPHAIAHPFKTDRLVVQVIDNYGRACQAQFEVKPTHVLAWIPGCDHDAVVHVVILA